MPHRQRDRIDGVLHAHLIGYVGCKALRGASLRHDLIDDALAGVSIEVDDRDGVALAA